MREVQTESWILPSSGLLRSVGWLRTDVSGQPIGPIFKGQVFGHLTLEGGTDRLSWNVGSYPTYGA